MQEKPKAINTASLITSTPRFLWFITVAYTMITAISNWYDARLIDLFGLVISPGTLIFPLTFLLSNIITEVYGYKHARRAILTAFVFNLFFLAYGQIVIHLPSPNFHTDNLAFDKLLNMNKWIIIGSFASYLISEPLNSYIVAKMKIVMKGRYMAIRFLVSTIIAAGLDSFLFSVIAFHDSLNFSQLQTLIVNIWLIKVVVELIGLTVSIRLTKTIKEKEQLDIYDYGTNYSLLSIEANYPRTNNQFANSNDR